jgi:hypothetical protein
MRAKMAFGITWARTAGTRLRQYRERRMPVIRIITTCAAIALSFAAARPAAAYSLQTLEPHERTAMLRTCMHLDGQQRSLCQQVVDDGHVIANDKRSCFEAMMLLLQGSTWSMVKSVPPTLTCRAGLSRAGYPVRRILQRLSGGT